MRPNCCLAACVCSWLLCACSLGYCWCFVAGCWAVAGLMLMLCYIYLYDACIFYALLYTDLVACLLLRCWFCCYPSHGVSPVTYRYERYSVMRIGEINDHSVIADLKGDIKAANGAVFWSHFIWRIEYLLSSLHATKFMLLFLYDYFVVCSTVNLNEDLGWFLICECHWAAATHAERLGW